MKEFIKVICNNIEHTSWWSKSIFKIYSCWDNLYKLINGSQSWTRHIKSWCDYDLEIWIEDNNIYGYSLI